MWFKQRLESILDNLIFAGLVAGGVAVWNVIRSLSPPIIAGISVAIFVFILLIIRLILYGLKRKLFPQNRKGQMIMTFGIVLIIGGIIGIFMVASQLKPQRELVSKTVTQSTTTQTTPPSKTTNNQTLTSTPSFTFPNFVDSSQINPSQRVDIWFGGNDAIYKWSDFQNGASPGTIIDLGAGIVPLTPHVIGGRLYLDVSVYGNSDFSPITVKDNLATVLPSNWDKNHDDYAYEVVNESGKPIFQLIYKTQFSIVVNGIFPIPRGGVMWVTQSGFIIGPSPFDVFHLDPIFKYPSSQYSGQRIMP